MTGFSRHLTGKFQVQSLWVLLLLTIQRDCTTPFLTGKDSSKSHGKRRFDPRLILVGFEPPSGCAIARDRTIPLPIFHHHSTSCFRVDWGCCPEGLDTCL